MSDKNEVRLIGSLVRNAEVRRTTTGKQVANFTIVTKVGKQSEYHSLVAWEEHAAAVQQLGVGSVIGVNGYLKTRSWEHNGQKKYKTEIIVNQIVIEGADDQPDYDTSAPVAAEDLPF